MPCAAGSRFFPGLFMRGMWSRLRCLRVRQNIVGVQGKHRATPKVFNSKAQGKPKRRSREAPPWVRGSKHIICTPTGFHVVGAAARVPCKTPLGYEFLLLHYPGCAGVPATAGLWNVTPSA